jgi:hypothetical protein
MIKGISSSLVVIALLLIGTAGLAQARLDWEAHRDAGYGFTFTYPTGLFHEIEGDEKPSFYYFRSSAADAKLLFGAWDNVEERTPEAFKSWLIANTGGYEETTYRPGGRSWFVLSGYRDNDIFYEKVMFSCAGRVVNVFAMSYPVSRRRIFDPVVERIENSFKPARRC